MKALFALLILPGLLLLCMAGVLVSLCGFERAEAWLTDRMEKSITEDTAP